MKKILATAAAAVTGITLGCGVQTAFAADTAQNTSSTHGWVWVSYGSQYGKCAAGYTPQLNRIDHPETATWATHDAGQSPYWTLTNWAGAQAFLAAHPNDATSVAYPMNDDDFPGLGDQHETTLPLGTDPDATAVYEGDCVPDGYSLPAPNSNFHGQGTVYPTPKPKPTPAHYYQHDVIKVTSKAQATQLAKLIHAGVLPYRGDKLSWGHSTWSFTTVPGHSKGRAVVGQTVDLYWALDTTHGAKPQQANGLAWGPKHNLVQTIVR